MKIIAAWVVAAFLALGGIVYAGQQDFTLVNDTGVDIAKIFISAASVDNWEENLLGEDEILPDGNELDISFDADEDADFWDIMVADEDGNAITWQRLKLTAISRVTLKFQKGKPVAVVE